MSESGNPISDIWEPEWGLEYCPTCNQMTNHDDNGCLKCRSVLEDTINNIGAPANKLNFYLVKFDKYGYDQYDRFLLAAKDEIDAIDFLKKKYPQGPYVEVCWDSRYTVELVSSDNYKETGIVISSFNAG